MKVASMLSIDFMVASSPQIYMLASSFIAGNPSPSKVIVKPPFAPSELGDTEVRERLCVIAVRESANGTFPNPSMTTSAL